MSAIVRYGTRLRVVGDDQARQLKGGSIFTANHLGILDGMITYHVAWQKDLIVLLAEKYRKNKFMRWAGGQMDVIFIDRFNADLGAFLQVYRRLKGGGVLMIAPEGTRSTSGAMLEGRPGAAYLALKAGCPVVPVGITGSQDENVRSHWRRLRRPEMQVRFGKPYRLIEDPSLSREANIERSIVEIMCQIGALLPESYRGVYRDHPRLNDLLHQTEA